MNNDQPPKICKIYTKTSKSHPSSGVLEESIISVESDSMDEVKKIYDDITNTQT